MFLNIVEIIFFIIFFTLAIINFYKVVDGNEYVGYKINIEYLVYGLLSLVFLY